MCLLARSSRLRILYASYFGQIDCMAWLLKQSSLTLSAENELGFVCLDTFSNIKLPKPLMLKLAFLQTDNYDNETLINQLSDEQKERKILATRSYIESKTRSQEELDQISAQFETTTLEY